MTEQTFAPVRRHGPIVQIAEHLWQVEGTYPVAFGMTITRNMTIVRQQTELTLINTVRLDPPTLAQLQDLGRVRHVVKLGHFHGEDDPFYVRTFSAQLWAQAGAKTAAGLAIDHVIDQQGAVPFSQGDPSWFVFRNAKLPEAALFLGESKALITCDSVQNWLPGLPGCSWFARFMMPKMGFSTGPLIGPFWRKYMKIEGRPLRDDFLRLCELPIEKVLVAHGSPIERTGCEAIRQATQTAFPT